MDAQDMGRARSEGGTGGVLTGGFAMFVAAEQKAKALTPKQQRLHAEEEDKRKDKNNGQGGKPKP